MWTILSVTQIQIYCTASDIHLRFHYTFLQKLSINLEGLGLSHLMGVQASPSRLRREGGLGVELAEVCIDMMARYTYSTLSTLPSRSVQLK